MKSILPIKRQFALLAAILLGYSAQAQVATTYSFTQSAGTYTAITGGTVLASAALGNLDEDYFAVSIPSFKFDGVSYSTVYISTNGYISFGESMDTYEYDPISGYYTYSGAIAGFGADLDDSGSGAGARNIRTEQVGNEFVIQWQNVRRYNVTSERISFQIRLNTITNEINIVYGGTITPGDDQTYPEIGLRGPDNDFATNVNNREILAGTGAWLNSVPGTSELSNCYFDSNTPATIPAAGTTFKWTPAPDITVQNFVFASTNECYSATETISLIVKNEGGTTIDFSVTPLTVNSSVSGTNPMTFTPIIVNTGTLAAGATQTIQIAPSYNMSLGGSSYSFDASISMTGDSRPSNNTLTQTRFNYSPTVTYSDITNCSGAPSVTLTGTSNFSIYNPMTANNTPVVIPDDDPTGVTSTIVVSNAGSATAASVIATIESLTHTYTSDLTITLTAPDGSSVDLYVEESGGGDANLINTVFSDAATDQIGNGINPYTGSFQPNTPFSGLTGPANGTWQISVTDNYAFDAGNLNSWSLAFPGTNSIVSYAWSPATDLSSTSVSNPEASPASTTTYAVTVTDTRGCTATDNVTVTIGSLAVTAASNAVSDMICEGESVILTGGGPATSFSWNNGVTDGVAFEPASTATYIVTGTDANGCSNTDTITVIVNNAPTVTASSDATGDMICEGESVILTGSGTATSFAWNNSVTDGTAFEPVVTATYIVTGTDANNCSNTDTITVVVNNNPTVTASSDAAANTICEGESVTLTGGGTAINYSWNNGVIDNDSFEPASTTTYTVTGTDANGCENTATITVTVTPLPNTTLNLTTTEFCENHAPQALSGGSPAGGTYSGTAVSGGMFNPSAAGEGVFIVTYTVIENNCSAVALDSITVDACLGLEETTQALLQVFPNPGKGIFTVSMTDSDQLTGISIVDAQGKQISFETSAPNGNTVIDLGQAENGVYFLKATLNGNQVITRLVKQ
jgi:subtilisin-like proprotein convertase family protein